MAIRDATEWISWISTGSRFHVKSVISSEPVWMPGKSLILVATYTALTCLQTNGAALTPTDGTWSYVQYAEFEPHYTDNKKGRWQQSYKILK